MTKDTIGVDISKDQLDAHRMSNGAKRRFTSDTVGHRAFMGWLGQTETIHDMRVVYLALLKRHNTEQLRQIERQMIAIEKDHAAH